MPAINPFKPSFEFNFRGIIAVPARALELKKVFIGALSLLAALALYDLFTYLAVLVDGLSAGSIFERHAFFPLASLKFASLAGKGIFLLGIAAGAGAIMTGSLAICIINIEELRGNRLYGAREGLRFALSRAKNMFYALLALALFIVFFSALLSLLGLLARIPFIGASAYSILFALPGFITAVLLTLVIVVFFLSILILPAAAAADRVGETFTAILESFSTVVRQPFRWFGYTLYTLGAGKVCVWALAGFSLLAVKFLGALTGLTGGKVVSQTIAGGAELLPLKSWFVEFTFDLWPKINDLLGAGPGLDVTRLSKGGEETFAAHLMAISLVLIFVYVWGYGVSIIATGQAYTYVILKKMRDDYDIAAEDPQFMQEEWINPPLEETVEEFSKMQSEGRESAHGEDDDDSLHDRET
ncbi:MAG: hypothetical protein ACE5GA_00750 [Candidatus Zixiibacteriota bacterium]